MAVKVVDHHNGHLIQKLTSPDGVKCFGYLALPDEYDGKDISKVRKFATLGEARSAIGCPTPEPVAFGSKPKASYPQNQKGYRADSIRGKKAA